MHRHSDEFVIKTVKLLKSMLVHKIYPSYLLNYLYSYIINTLNGLKSENEVSVQLTQYCHELIKETKTEVQFLRMWKQRVVEDAYYDENKLGEFMEADGEFNPMFKKLVKQIN